MSITGIKALKSISPNSGSIYGGTVLTITGNGFDSTTKVLIDTTVCKITNYTINTLKCLTGAHVAASGLNFQIRYFLF